mgnify:CR=1 FL=1
MTKTGLKNEHPTSNIQRRIMVRLRRFNFIKNTERSDIHIRRWMLSVRCSTFIFFLFVISNFGHAQRRRLRRVLEFICYLGFLLSVIVNWIST